MANDPIFDAIANAKKIAGKKYKAPKLDAQAVQVSKGDADFHKSFVAFSTARTALEKTLLALQNSNSGLTNLYKLIVNGIAQADFGLDPQNAEDKKKIDQCKKLINDALNKMTKTNADDSKKLDELDKHMSNLSGYKGPSP